MKKIVRLTESDLIKLVKRVINEQSYGINDYMSKPGSGVLSPQGMKERDRKIGWNVILKGLGSYGNPKRIMTPEGQSLNWGMHKGSGYNWGLSIADDSELRFQTPDETQSKLFLNEIKKFGYDVDPRYFGITRQGKTTWSEIINMDNSNPEKIIKMVKNLVDVLSGWKG